MPFSDGRLFRIARGGAAPSYILGTLHLADTRLVALAREQDALVRGASTVVLELPPARDGSFRTKRAGDRRSSSSAARPKPAQSIRDLLKPAEIAQLKQALSRRGIAPTATEAVSPAALVFLLDQPTCQPLGSYNSMDQVISEEALAAKRETIGLETLQEQLAIFDLLSPDELRDALLAALAQAQVAGVVQDASLRLYLKRRIGDLLTWTRSPHLLPSIGGPAMPPRLLSGLIDARNERMESRLRPLLVRGNVFAAIGILHLPGEGGVLARLLRDGFSVEVVK